jgi:hypothetical protein
MQLARFDVKGTPGGLIDFSLLSNTNSFTLKSDTTYLVSGQVSINNLTIEGGSVIKFSNAANATITATNVICKNLGPYRMATFTACDDQSIGEVIGTNAVSGYYGGTALDLLTGGSGQALSYLRFQYLSNALDGIGVTLRNSQIVQCKNGFGAGSRQASVYNCLLYSLTTAVNQGATVGDSFTGENITAHNCTNFLYDTTGTINLTNCILAGSVANWQCTHTNLNKNFITNNDAGIFVTLGTGGHYLPTNSVLLGTGTTVLDGTLLSDLRSKTVAAPILFDSVIITFPLVLYPQAVSGH